MDVANGSRADVAQRAWAAIAAVRDPEIGVSLEKLGMLRGVEIIGTTVIARIALTIPGCPMKERIAKDVAAALRGVDGIDGVEVRFDAMDDEQRGALVSRLRGSMGAERFFGDGRTSVIAVASGKGGVGKSTVTVNLACAIAATGRRVGVIDADVWGFSVPRLLGVTEAPAAFDGMLFPAQAHGVKLMSVGLFAEPSAPVVWRGPLLHKTMRQFLGDVHWGELDVVLCDLPPGTGDVPISLAAMLPSAGVVVVTTPQESVREVAERAGRMAEHARLRVVGVIENMSGFLCPCCGERTSIFGEGGGELLARSLGAPLLASVPMTPQLRASGDAGVPLVVTHPDDPASAALRDAAQQLLSLAPATGATAAVAPAPVQLPIVHTAGFVVNVDPEGSVQ